jgi:hypothetical protein
MSYEISITSDTAYGELVAEILFDNGELLVVSHERCKDQFKVSIYSRYRDSGEAVTGPLAIDFGVFSDALADAKQKLTYFSSRRA